MTDFPLVYRWGNNPVRASRKGQRCRVLVRSTRMRSVLIQFTDGGYLVTSARAVAPHRDPQEFAGILL